MGILFMAHSGLRYLVLLAGVLALAKGWIAGLFTDNATALSTASLHMSIVPWSYAALGAAMTVNSAFNAIGKPMPAMFVSLTRTALLYAPLAFLFAHLFGLIGVFAAAFTANLLAGTVGALWFRGAFRQQRSAAAEVAQGA